MRRMTIGRMTISRVTISRVTLTREAMYRMRTLLLALCLRRRKDDPLIAAQSAIPPLSWHTLPLTFSPTERATYESALDTLRRSHRAYARAAAGGGASASARARRASLLGARKSFDY